jgi:hypothetical protein
LELLLAAAAAGDRCYAQMNQNVGECLLAVVQRAISNLKLGALVL